jgi:hypothetical protein
MHEGVAHLETRAAEGTLSQPLGSALRGAAGLCRGKIGMGAFLWVRSC